MSVDLPPLDVIAGAAVPDRPNLFVIGCFDKRVTFYSQQVRALALVHALLDQGYLGKSPRIAVVGGGAAGATAAAASALLSEGQVYLFERASALIPLQSITDRRKLDPHLYDWPAFDTNDPIANLPILDWEAGSCKSVREDILLQIADIEARTGGRLIRRTRHEIPELRQVGSQYELVFEDLDHPSDDETTDRFDIVILAIGFGLEPTEAIQNIQSSSYWSDAGVPVAEFEGRPSPKFFVSGNGDGGLIDFVAAGSTNFNHAGMIRLIADHPGIGDLTQAIINIESRARAAAAKDERFDFIAAYDAELFGTLTAIGLVAEFAAQLRPGVQLTFQTQHPEMFEVQTSALNRLAAYLTIKTCQADPVRGFQHIICQNVVRIEAPDPNPNPAPFRLDCEGTVVAADAAIVRWGPLRARVREPFGVHLDAYESEHKKWLERHGNANSAPILSSKARHVYTDRARSAQIPMAPRIQRQAAANASLSVQMQLDGAQVRWSGAVPPEGLVRAWSERQAFDVIFRNAPDELAPAGNAALRVACHAPHIRLHADPARWHDYIHRLSVMSPHAEAMNMPQLQAGNPGGAAQDPITDNSVRIARRIHRALDQFILHRLDEHIAPFLANGSDPGRLIGFGASADLRHAMHGVWAAWRASFEDEADLLSRFLCLTLCAVDDDHEREAAQILVGPEKLAAIVRGTAVALAIAAAWQSTSPKGARPGNLFRTRPGEEEWSGHSCAADRIAGDAMALCASAYMWQTNFVILSVQGTIELAVKAQQTFAKVATGQPSLDEITGAGPILIWISLGFKQAAEQGLPALIALLAEIEKQHFDRLESAIEKVAVV